VQNFAPIGRRSSEITRREKKENKPQQNLSPLPQAIAYGGLIIIISRNTSRARPSVHPSVYTKAPSAT